MPLHGWSGVVRYGVPGVLLGLALMGGFGNVRWPRAQAENLPGIDRPRAAAAGGDSSGMIAFTSPSVGAAQLLYLIDTRTRSFAIYRVDPTNAKGAVRLEATRQYQWDMKLTEYNNDKPDVVSVETMIKTVGQPNR
jgi:hypothetical protein